MLGNNRAIEDTLWSLLAAALWAPLLRGPVDQPPARRGSSIERGSDQD